MASWGPGGAGSLWIPGHNTLWGSSEPAFPLLLVLYMFPAPSIWVSRPLHVCQSPRCYAQRLWILDNSPEWSSILHLRCLLRVSTFGHCHPLRARTPAGAVEKCRAWGPWDSWMSSLQRLLASGENSPEPRAALLSQSSLPGNSLVERQCSYPLGPPGYAVRPWYRLGDNESCHLCKQEGLQASAFLGSCLGKLLAHLPVWGAGACLAIVSS